MNVFHVGLFHYNSRFFPRCEAETDSFCRAASHAVAAADAFGAVDVFHGVDAHAADRGTFAAAYAGAFIHAPSVQRHAVKAAVQRAERAEVLAERPEDKQAEKNQCDKDRKLPAEKAAEHAPDRLVRRREEERCRRSRGADVLAEKRCTGNEKRQDDTRRKDEILQLPKRLIKPEAVPFSRRNEVQQFLQPAHGTEETADRAAEQRAEKDQQADHVIRDAEGSRA